MLTHTSQNLGDVDGRALGAGYDHGLEIIRSLEGLLRTVAGVVTSLVEDLVDHELERLQHGPAGLPLELALLRFDQALVYFVLDLDSDE